MKVANIFLGRSKRSEAEEAINYCSDILNQLGIKVLSIVHPDSPAVYDLVKLPIKLKTLKYHPWLDIFATPKLEGYIRKFSPDLIIVYDEYSYFKISNVFKIPVIYFLGEKINKKIICDAVFYNEYSKWEKYSSFIDLSVPSRNYFVQTSSYAKINNKSDDDIIVFGIKLDKDSDQDLNLLFKAFSLLELNNKKRYKLLILNHFKNNDDIDNLIRHFRLENMVEITPSNLKSKHFINLIDIYLTCPYEQISSKEVLVAINNKIPVIVPSNVALQDSVIHGVNGFVFRKSNVNSLADLLQKIILYPSFLSNIITRDKQNAIEQQKIDYFYKIVEEILINSNGLSEKLANRVDI